MILHASTPNHDESMVSELLPQHGTNANKRQLVAGGRGGTVPQALCGDSR